MLQLYFFPMACSLSSRIALLEAGIEAQYHLAHIWTKRLVDDGGDFLRVSPKGAVPVLVLENGERLTESAAVLQYIADVKPEARLAPRPGDFDRYRLQEWLSFVSAEIHKAFLFPTFWYKDDGSLAKPRARIMQTLSVPAAHLAGREFLVGDGFTVADAHLTWTLLLLRPAGIDIAQWPSLAAYLERMQARPAVRRAIATEMALRKTVAASAA
ncbi:MULTISPECIES: glutathione binding-like protein [unclassified Bradyrhizobium]|uniref:glutathione binding-like protein n=1 Tax=unclassified Bradyrhizobium TaxID=2631580 RepID=UPI002302B8FF|nr:glutathione binding-like protein [Bradyrhizobium sp. CCBAU 45321]MDA9548224.1 glutathione S-transferase [Bradyrhizobium sp. CCBAU 45321]